MGENGPDFQLPKKIETYLSALSRLYAQDGKSEGKRSIIVNAKVRVTEDWENTYWSSSTAGHALFLTIPEQLFVERVRHKASLQDQIRDDINHVCTVPNEYISEVFLDLEPAEDHDWRKESGLLLSGERVVQPEAEKRIWGADGYRLFLSHKASVKKEAAGLKEALGRFGVSCFVAHQDIIPTREWQTEIENALHSMDSLAALLTPDFHDSLWTDQETGFAFGRGIPIVCVKLGLDPYGFIGKFQALSCSWQDADVEIAKLLLKNERMVDSYIKALPSCIDLYDGNCRAKVLPAIDKLSERQAAELVSAFNSNVGLLKAYGFNG